MRDSVVERGRVMLRLADWRGRDLVTERRSEVGLCPGEEA